VITARCIELLLSERQLAEGHWKMTISSTEQHCGRYKSRYRLVYSNCLLLVFVFDRSATGCLPSLLTSSCKLHIMRRESLTLGGLLALAAAESVPGKLRLIYLRSPIRGLLRTKRKGASLQPYQHASALTFFLCYISDTPPTRTSISLTPQKRCISSS